VNRAVAWFASNHVAANLLMALVVVGGLLQLPSVKREVFPEIALPVISVSVPYPGASPSEVEDAVCVRVEEVLQGLQGIKRIHSTASEGHGTVSVELLAGEDERLRLDQIRSRVDGIETFPDEVERPVVSQADLRFQVLTVAVSGNVDERTLKRLGERARDEIASLPGVTDVDLVATRPYEIAIEVSEDALRRHGLTLDQIAAAVERSSLDLPGGSIKTDGGEILIRTLGQARSATDFEQLVLVSRADGTRLLLGDVGRVVDGFTESDELTLFDGEPAVLVQVYRVGQQSALEIAATIERYLTERRESLPEGVHFTLAQNDARFLRGRLDTLLSNAGSGFVLVFVVLALFLRLRLALWVSLGIPVAFLGALALLPTFDVSINLISLMGFIVVLGIVVDDAIVVGEHTCTEQARTGDGLRGAVLGASGVGTPVVFGVLTTVVAFAPLLWVPGPMGRVARVIPVVVCLCLLFSLLESLFILPSHLALAGGASERGPDPEDPRLSRRISRAWRDFQDRIAAGLQRFTLDTYRPLLERALEWRYTTAAASVAVLWITAGLLFGGWIQMVFQPEIESDITVAYVQMPQGTPTAVTAAAVKQIADAARAVAEDADASRDVAREGSVFAHFSTSVGRQPYRIKQASGPSSFAAAGVRGSHLGEVQIEVVDGEKRDVSVAELTRRWRERTGEIVGAEEVTFTSSLIASAAAIQIELMGPELATLRAAADHVASRLRRYPGVLDIRDSFETGKRELELELLPSAEALGLSVQDLGRQVRQAFYGEEVQRLQRGRDDVKVVVRYPEEERRAIADLENMRIRTADGSAVPFSTVARASLGNGFASIRRVDRRRVVAVTADVDNAVTNAGQVLADLQLHDLPEVGEIFPGVQVSIEGEQREQKEFLASLQRGWLIALLGIYALLAIPLRSYVQPVIIMSAIPFGLVGAVWGHVFLGLAFSMFSLIGLVALSGVVVNDSLVLVDWVNRERAGGAGLRQALVSAGTARLRAILLTSATTFAGLTPLLLETSVQARMLIPMATSLAFGVVFATVITLLLVPAYYLILDDCREALAARWRGRGSRDAPGDGAHVFGRLP
jgi:multidrug efflux pump subunit AcrB